MEIIGEHRWAGLHLQAHCAFEMRLLMVCWKHVVAVSKIWVLFASLPFHLLLKLLVDLFGVNLALFHVIPYHSSHKLVLFRLSTSGTTMIACGGAYSNCFIYFRVAWGRLNLFFGNLPVTSQSRTF